MVNQIKKNAWNASALIGVLGAAAVTLLPVSSFPQKKKLLTLDPRVSPTPLSFSLAVDLDLQ